ncbi:hypothetical protein AB0F36_26515 [Streptomyces sp. NPDC029080]|uniref:hypothetical protein n=1 Tax=Streptomyces sp. NPDC029080 TaxID=3155017 RepID=UPI0033E03353
MPPPSRPDLEDAARQLDGHLGAPRSVVATTTTAVPAPRAASTASVISSSASRRGPAWDFLRLLGEPAG